jgi:hypothetical protein
VESRMRGNVHVRFGGRERGNGAEETRPLRPLPTRHLSYSNRYADLLFEVVTRRYDQQRSIVISTNKAFAEWSEVFPHAACTVTLVDRLVHRSEILEIEGASYRLKEAKERAAQRSASRRSKKTAA